MKTTHLCTRKYNKEPFIFYLNEPSYKGEKGYLGIEIEPYITVVAPHNAFGYADTILLDSQGHAYSCERFFPKWILKKIEKKMIELMTQHKFERSL